MDVSGSHGLEHLQKCYIAALSMGLLALSSLLIVLGTLILRSFKGTQYQESLCNESCPAWNCHVCCCTLCCPEDDDCGVNSDFAFVFCNSDSWDNFMIFQFMFYFAFACIYMALLLDGPKQIYDTTDIAVGAEMAICAFAIPAGFLVLLMSCANQ